MWQEKNHKLMGKVFSMWRRNWESDWAEDAADVSISKMREAEIESVEI